MKSFKLILMAIFCYVAVFAQNNGGNKIVGVVYSKTGDTKKPLAKASVYIPGVAGSSVSDDKGYYSLDLSQCSKCKAGESVKLYVNSNIGYVERDYTIPTNPELKPFEIEITENKKLALNGLVRDKQTGRMIKGIKVTVIIQNYDIPIPSTTTDDNGAFQVIIRKEGILNMQAIQLVFADANNSKYKDLEKVVFINQYEPVKVEMEECSDCGSKYELAISTHIRSAIKVEQGDLVIIKASGAMKVGNFVGNSGPEGIPNNRGVLGVSLESYNYFAIQNHAVLFYRFGESDSWKFYEGAKENKYVVQSGGYIEFGVNDRQESDNSGAYKVEVTIRK